MELLPGDYASPRWTYEILDCSMPMTFDTYSNCAFQCVYCFSFFQRAVGQSADDYLHHRVKAVSVERVKRMFRGEIPNSQFNWYIRSRRVLQWGGLSDGFDYYEKQFGRSLDLLTFFNSIDYPVSISTKGVWWTEDSRYQEAFRNRGNVHLKTSIVTLDAAKAKKLERGVASPEERFRMLEWAAANGVAATTVRLRPFVLGITADYPFTDVSKSQIEALVQRTKQAGVYSLTTEFLCLEKRASSTAKERYDIIGDISGINDLYRFYATNSLNNGLMRLNYELKRPYMETLQEACYKYGIHFFVSDAHHKEKSEHAGCCGLPDTGPLSVTNKGQYAEAILIAKRNGRVHWSDISEAAEALRNIPFGAGSVEGGGNAAPEGFNLGSTNQRAMRMYQTMYDYMRDMWNNPRSFMSPARYFGGALVPDSPDDNGDIVYLYNAPWTDSAVQVQSVGQLRTIVNREHGQPTTYIKLETTASQQLADLQQATREQQADGGRWGHIAYDIVINATLSTDPELHQWLMALLNNKINATCFIQEARLDYCLNTYNDWGVEFDALPDNPATDSESADNKAAIVQGYAMLGTPRIWLLEPTLTTLRVPPQEFRAKLSSLEESYANGILSAADRAHLALYGITLVECAELDHEVTL
jgi:DNA repair photolyase